MRLQGKAAIVTGGGSGFGEGIVRKFVAEGAKVLIADRDEAAAKRVADATGARWLRVDVSRADDVKEMADAAFAHFGALDSLRLQGRVDASLCAQAIERYAIATERGASWNG